MKKLFFTILFAFSILNVKTASCQITLDSLEVQKLIDLIEAYEIQKTQLDTLYKRYLFQDEVIYQLRTERAEIRKEIRLHEESVKVARRQRWLFGAGGVFLGVLVALLI